MKINPTKLKSKGWTDEEINHAMGVLEKADAKKNEKYSNGEKLTYFVLFIAIILCAFIIAWIIQPLLLLSTQKIGIIIVSLAGLFYGTFASLTIRMFEKIERHHFVLLSITIPLASLLSATIIILKINKIISTKQVYHHNPYLFGACFTLASIIPYIIYIIMEKRKK